MKPRAVFSILFLALFSLIGSSAYANGVGVIDASKGTYLKLDSSSTQVSIDDQVAIVTTRQSLRNVQSDSVHFKYAFPLPASASAVSLRWYRDGKMYEASIAAKAQDTTLPGGGGSGGSSSIHPDLKRYLGASPLLFDITHGLPAGASISIELTYVELLSYDLGQVVLSVPQDYALISTDPILYQHFDLELSSSRTIDSFYTFSHSPDFTSNDGHHATISYTRYEQRASDLGAIYRLNSSELGLYGYSTYRDSSVDEHGRGFLLFLVEPDASEATESLQKVFTLVIDRSGSMSGEKIVQARNAASFIVDNLNEGDRFNIIDFSSDVRTFKPLPVGFDLSSKQEALDYIGRLSSDGGTNIHDALLTALRQYGEADSTVANIVLFFTDGEATSGITTTSAILEDVRKANADKGVTIFPFGIGSSVNTQLLTLLASENGGIADFLLQSELQAKISKFYLKVRNPVLLNPVVSFKPNVIEQTYPKQLPHLYKGQQLLISGRYTEAVNPLTIELTGNAFGKPVTYTYTLNLADSVVERYSFLTKVWAKMKIEELTRLFRTFPSNSDSAKLLKDQITEISLLYGVITNFTSFSDAEDNSSEVENTTDISVAMVRAYPTPFTSCVKILLTPEMSSATDLRIDIFDARGGFVRSLKSIAGAESAEWDGLDENGNPVASGVYICVITYEGKTYAVKVQRAK